MLPKCGQATHHIDFLNGFTQRENERRLHQKPKALSAEQRAAQRQLLKKIRFLKPANARSTKINIAHMLRKWKVYCRTAELGPWMEAITKVDKAMAMDFLDHLCEKGNVKSKGTSWEYWRQYKQLYSSLTGQYFDRIDCQEIQKWHDGVLVPRWRLRPPNVDGKPVLGTNDLLVLQTFNIAYDEGVFTSERHRIQLSGCYLLLALTGARPAEIVDNEKRKPKDGSWEDLYGSKPIATDDPDVDSDTHLDEDSRLLEDMLCEETMRRGRPKALCYEDISLSIVRHPETGEDIPTMAIKFINHKGADRKPKPTIFFFTGTRRLLFCIITVIVSLAISDQAFDAPSLTSACKVFQLRNRGARQCTELRWKEEWLKRPVFRGFDGSSVSQEKPLPYHKLNDDMERQTLDAGFEKAFGPRAFRRGAANAANGKAPDTVRDQMMRHDPKWATFNNAYINEKVEFHLERVVADEPTEDCLIDLFTHMSLTRDPKAKQNMVPDKVLRNLPPDPEIVALEEKREQLKKGRYRIQGAEHEEEIRQLTRSIRTKRAQREKDLRRQYREYYFYHRPTWEIERQLAGDSQEDEGSVEVPVVDLHLSERARLAKLLCHQPDDLSFDEFCQIRIEAAELMVALCEKRETVKRKCIPDVRPNDVAPKDSPTLDSFPLMMGKTQCPYCIGDEALSFAERTFSYCRPAVMNDHFDREHLDTLTEMGRNGSITCNHPRCKEADLELTGLDHLKNHIERVHGVRLRPSGQKAAKKS
ncbi:hypothetical protein HIM_09851 [Hirsutella minnesotensis 3608]|uniref:FluG domain-containing protein n=1 Tax=Hirsutella minnesotensis 3608 TaxID=1043627 RepID=A0A0F7ZXI2_9HYPO|nr:hypothetical protein HIM_09851 [Hirsutella minnesotensis 3608]